MLRRVTLVLGVATILAVPATAQLNPLLDIRIGAQVVVPQADLGDVYNSGFGVYGRLGIPLGGITLMGTATLTRFPGRDLSGTLVRNPSENVIGLSAGPQFSLPMLDLGIEVGFLSTLDGDGNGNLRNKVGIVPRVSFGVLNFDVMASYTIVQSNPQGSWLALGVGLRF